MLKDKAFTSIELVVVLTIIGIIAGMSTHYLREDKLNGATRMVYSDLQLARIKAIKEKNKFRVLFNLNGHTYQIHDNNDNDYSIDTGEELIDKDIHTNFKGVLITSFTNPSFNSIGSSNAGRITLTEDNRSKYIIFSSTGRIRIGDVPPL
ncbi:MAG: GspH/FimT family pseudopilin [bacterium]